MGTRTLNLNDLFIFELANNHQGDLKHAMRIIRALGEIATRENISAAVKFQFRHLESMIHPSHHENSSNKHIPRFFSTRLKLKDYEKLQKEIHDLGMLSMCTPFDEESVDHLKALDIDIVKIASCSATDWPLIEKIRKLSKPVVASTAGLSFEDIGQLVEKFSQHTESFALMHCVALYPTPPKHFNLGRITELKTRYPKIPIGYSTHEEPDEVDAVKIAYGCGARIFEKHVGAKHGKITLNAYSAEAEQITTWIAAYKSAALRCQEFSAEVREQENAALNQLRRGVFAKRKIKKGETLNANDVFFAMPIADPAQCLSGQWQDGAVADQDYAVNAPVSQGLLDLKKVQLEKIRRSTLDFIAKAHVQIPKGAEMQISHHYGLDKFYETGAVIFNCINRLYCKKIIILMPGQSHPKHMHKKKDESFQILHGDLELHVGSKTFHLKAGDIHHLPPGTWHEFKSAKGVVIEEISTTHFADDSYYEDRTISKVNQARRKTFAGLQP